jgi:hypothetical protein
MLKDYPELVRPKPAAPAEATAAAAYSAPAAAAATSASIAPPGEAATTAAVTPIKASVITQ